MNIIIEESERTCQAAFSGPTAAELEPPYPSNIQILMDEIMNESLTQLIEHFFPEAVPTLCGIYHLPESKVQIFPDGQCHDFRDSSYSSFEVFLAFEKRISVHEARVEICDFLAENGDEDAVNLLWHFRQITNDRKCAIEEGLPKAPALRRYTNNGYHFLTVKCPYCDSEETHGDYPLEIRVSHCTRLWNDDFPVGGSYVMEDLPCCAK
ncbi:MAG: hypothetical protein A2W19_07350 [Spirochaetes bacterium RBG_16_49_21]|nr:MAG: hypothetical protein A2W19_07350 [Spirochaetes bacterium RBG_16_49_21]